MIDFYFRRPVFWDYFLGVLVLGGVIWLREKTSLKLPDDEIIISVISDLSTVSLTLAGFILTLLTVVISFKSAAKPKKEIDIRVDSLHDIFYSTSLYFETVKHLKHGVMSLTFIAISGYCLKLLVTPPWYNLLFGFNVLILIIVFMTLWRCLLILSKIIKIQKGE